ncbi:MAG: 16S rRNA (guanine(966)-N(2))-methyltransferase RsmD [Planctomycetota bacterium]
MRIIAGEARGRRLQAPAGRGTRPILDQLKERLFNILGPQLEAEVVWDLFAGAGSLGLEALSRGAASCVFVDQDKKAQRVIEQNLATLGYEDRARVSASNAMVPASFARDEDSAPDLIFSDPPFPLVLDQPDLFAAYFEALRRDSLAPGGRLVFRYPSELRWPKPPAFLDVADLREQGVNVLVIVDKDDPA